MKKTIVSIIFLAVLLPVLVAQGVSYFYYDVSSNPSTFVFGSPLKFSDIKEINTSTIESFKDISIQIDNNDNNDAELGFGDVGGFFNEASIIHNKGTKSSLILKGLNSNNNPVTFSIVADVSKGTLGLGNFIIDNSRNISITNADSGNVIKTHTTVIENLSSTNITTYLAQFIDDGDGICFDQFFISTCGTADTLRLPELQMENTTSVRADKISVPISGARKQITDLYNKSFQCAIKSASTSVSCAPGEVAVGGACSSSSNPNNLGDTSRPTPNTNNAVPTGWQCSSGFTATVTCCKFD